MGLFSCVSAEALTNGLNGGTFAPFYPSGIITNVSVNNGASNILGAVTNNIAYITVTNLTATATNIILNGNQLTNSTNITIKVGAVMTNVVLISNTIASNILASSGLFTNGVTNLGNVVISSNLTTGGTNTALYFVGNGGGLTNIQGVGSSNSIANNNGIGTNIVLITPTITLVNGAAGIGITGSGFELFDNSLSLWLGTGARGTLPNGTTAVGDNSLFSLNTNIAGPNTVFGQSVLSSLSSGGDNTVVGRLGGNAYIGAESDDTIFGDNVSGVTGENHVMRLGTPTTVTAYVAGQVTGNGFGLTNLNATNLNGIISAIHLPPGVVGNYVSSFSGIATNITISGIKAVWTNSAGAIIVESHSPVNGGGLQYGIYDGANLDWIELFNNYNPHEWTIIDESLANANIAFSAGTMTVNSNLTITGDLNVNTNNFSVSRGGVVQAQQYEDNSGNFYTDATSGFLTDTAGAEIDMSLRVVGNLVQSNGVISGNGSGLTNLNVNQSNINPRLGYVTYNSGRLPNFDNTGIPTIRGQRGYIAAVNITNVALSFPGFKCPSEVNHGGTALIRAAIQYPSNQTTSITFSGTTNGSLAAGTILTSDLVTLPTPIPQGALFWVRLWYTNAAGIYYANVSTVYGSNSFQLYSSYGLAVTDNTTSTIFDSPSINDANYDCCGVIGYNPNQSVIILGDSRDEGQNDYNWTTLLGIDKVIGKYYGLNNLSAGGDGTPGTGAVWTQRLTMCKYATVAWSDLGFNGFNSSAQSNIASFAISTGLPFVGETITPNTTSSDNWATLANQSVNHSFDQYNNDMRSNGIAGITACFDTAGGNESGLNSGQWQVNGVTNYLTIDGVHGPYYQRLTAMMGDPLRGSSPFVSIFGGQLNGALQGTFTGTHSGNGGGLTNVHINPTLSATNFTQNVFGTNLTSFMQTVSCTVSNSLIGSAGKTGFELRITGTGGITNPATTTTTALSIVMPYCQQVSGSVSPNGTWIFTNVSTVGTSTIMPGSCQFIQY